MDSLLSLQIPPNTFPTAPNSAVAPPTATPIAVGTSIPNLLVPKSEPLDDFFATQNHQQPHHAAEDDEPDIYGEFYRLSQLFHAAINKTLPQFGAQNTNTPHQDLVLLFGNPKIPVPDMFSNSGSGHVADPEVVVVGDQNSLSGDGNAAVSDQSSRAIVPVPAASPSSSAVVSVRRRNSSKVKELVRVMDLSGKDQMHFRQELRQTRMIYDSLRVLAVVEEEKRAAEEKRVAEEKRAAEEKRVAEEKRAAEEMRAAAAEQLASYPEGVPVAAAAAPEAVPVVAEPEAVPGGRRHRYRIRGDLRAAALMRERGLWMNRAKRIVGAIPGVFVGDLFLFRMELCVVGLHGQIQAGIDYLPASMCSNGEPIATSVIVSGGYEDDMDDGEEIIYTGHGGQGKNSSKQVCHQKLEGGNLALERSMHYGIEVRVIRGMRDEGSASAAGKVYVYDGLYKIVACWFDMGKSGFGVYKFKLLRIEGQPKMGSAFLKEAREIRRNGLDFKPVHCLSVDISNKKENVAIRLFNDIDDNQDPLYFEYLPRTIFPQFVFHQSGNATGCDCIDGCVDGCFCSMKNGGELPYNQNGFLVRGKPLIFECGPFCSCPPHCRNRATQKGLKSRLEVFRSVQTGWGVRSLDIIHAGAFICEYTGVVLTREQAQILTMNGDSLIYPNRFASKWAEWGDLSRVYPDYKIPSYPEVPPLDYSLDVSTMRNVACYISHSSSPNVLVQFVLHDHNNLMFPHLMLFAMENIPPMRELSLDYGVADEWTGKLSICNVTE